MSPPFYFVYFFLFSFLLLILINKRRSVNLPPGPRKLPVIGNLHQFGNSPQKSLHILSLKHGPIMLLQLGCIPTLVISSADVAKQIFKTHDLIFSGRPSLYAAKKFSYNFSNITFAPYGEYWRQVRKITVLELLSMKRVASFGAIRSEEVAQTILNIARSSSTPINFSKLMLSLSNNVICRAVFGKKGGNDDFNVHKILEETQALSSEVNMADFFPWMGWLNKFNGVDRRINKNFRELDELYDRVIADHLDPDRPKPDQDDLVDVLLRIQKDETQISLGDEQIKGILTDMFIAGTDTTAATLVWIMTELIKNPSSMKKAKQEIRKHVSQKCKSLEEDDVSELVYLKSVVKEALRLHPPVPLLLPRETTEACVIGGYAIPAKTRVFINAKSISTDPNHWEDPDEFKPDRFVNKGFDMEVQGYEMLPFGAGRRGCPGSNFSSQLTEFAVASLLYNFEWSLPEGMSREDVDTEESVGTAVHKKNPLILVASAVISCT